MNKIETVAFGVAMSFCGVALLLCFWMLFYMIWNAEYLCAKRWEGSYETTFTYMSGGCLVIVDGKPVPEKAVKVMR